MAHTRQLQERRRLQILCWTPLAQRMGACKKRLWLYKRPNPSCRCFNCLCNNGARCLGCPSHQESREIMKLVIRETCSKILPSYFLVVQGSMKVTCCLQTHNEIGQNPDARANKGTTNQDGRGNTLKASTTAAKHQSGATNPRINKRSTRKDQEIYGPDGGDKRWD